MAGLSFILNACLKRQNKTNFLTEQSLNKFLDNALKKRKNNKNNMKNNNICTKNAKKYTYKQINKFNINIDFKEIEYAKKHLNILWCENEVLNNREKVEKACNCVFQSYKNYEYRMINGKIIILEIAKSYVFLSVNKSGFDCVKHFRNLVLEYKLYKKEIQILPVLVKYFFLKKLETNLNEICKIRCNILKNMVNIDKNKYNYKTREGNYAFLKYAPDIVKFKYNSGECYKACYELSTELLNLASENRVILLWLDSF